MKRLFLIVLLLSTPSYAADEDLLDQTEETAPTTDAMMYIVKDPLGVPLDRKATIANIFKSFGFYLNSSDVGIGTANPVTKFEVDGTITADQFSSIVGALPQVQFESSGTDTDYTLGVNSDSGNDDDDSFQLVEGLALGNNVRISVKGSNVGIGTANPPSKLYVTGQIESTSGYKFPDGSIQTTALLGAPGWGDLGTVVSLSTSSDNVGIGTITAEQKVTVSGNTKSTEFHTPFGNTPTLNLIPSQVSDTGFSVLTHADGGNDDDDYFQIVEGDTAGTNVRFTIDGTGNVGVGTTVPRQRFVVGPPATETIASAGTITANACGTIKRLDAGSSVTTNTTNTFTAPASGYEGCCMFVVNVDTADTITLDNNAKFFSVGAANVALGPGDTIQVCSDGTSWYGGAVGNN